jgi:hypothetical protein
MIRPIITAAIEYLLAYQVYKYGKYQKTAFFWVLFFLASYQLGEVFIFLTNGSVGAFRLAYVSTTLLPPLGIYLLEKMTKKNYGSLLFQVIALGFVVFILTTPQVALNFSFGQFCVRVHEYHPIMVQYWTKFYQGTLLYSMLIMVWEIWNNADKKLVEKMKLLLIAYFSFDGLAIFIATLVPWFQPSVASLMCALALIASFIFADLSLEKKFNVSILTKYFKI